MHSTLVSRLQLVDQLVGVPLCALLTGINSFLPQRARKAITSIAFVKLSEQGATVLAAPALREAASRVGRQNVFFVAFKGNREILDLMEILPAENVIEIPTTSIPAFLNGVFRSIMLLRRRRIDACIDLDFFTRGSAILTWLSGAPTRVGLHSYFGEGPYRGRLMTHRPRYNPHIHTSRLFLSFVHALPHPPEAFPTWQADLSEDAFVLPKAGLPEAERSAARALLRRTLAAETLPPIVLLNANCSDMVPLRRWAAQRYVELAQRLLEHAPGIAILFTGSECEADEAAHLAAAVGSSRSHSIAGKTSILELLAVYELSALLVSNDSGPVHFASLTGIPTIALFGPETPALFRPLSQNAISLHAGLPCSPCVSAQNNRRSACKNNLCMQAITVDEVFAAAIRFLDLPHAKQ